MAKPLEQEQELKFVGNQVQVSKVLRSEKRSITRIKIILSVCAIALIVLGLRVYRQNQIIESKQKTLNLTPTQDELALDSLKKVKGDTNIEQLHSTQTNIPKGSNQAAKIQLRDNNSAASQQTVKKSQIQKQSQQMRKFEIPKNVWVFVEDAKKQTLFVQRCLKNIQHFSEQSNFKVKFISTQNYKEFISADKFLKIDKTMKMLQERMKNQDSLKYRIDTIRKNLITLEILNENGGILVQKNILFTQNFDWIEQINSNVYVNKGSKQAEAKYVAFYNIDHGSIPKKQNKLGITYEPQSYMIRFPSVQPYFLAAQQKGEYLTLVLEAYYAILLDPTNVVSKIERDRFDLGVIRADDLYQALIISFQTILQLKQRQLDAHNSLFKIFAIDYFGLYTINQRYFPRKIEYTFQRKNVQIIYRNLARYTIKQFEQSLGPMRYIVSMVLQNEINFRLEKSYSMDQRYSVHPHSFLAKFVVLNGSQEFIMKTIQKPFVESEYRPWTALPRILWLYWDTGIQNSSLANKLCIENLRRTAKESNFQFREVNNSNLEDYLGSQLHTKIKGFIQNKKIQIFPQTKSDFVRISLIAKYGGVYMDASYISVQSFQWIINIANYPSQFIFNRYGKLPKVVMLFHPHYGNPLQWQYDQAANTKRMIQVAYQSNLIIAEPNQQFFWLWLEEHGKFLTSPYVETDKLIKQYNVYEYKWTSKSNSYLAVMDAIKMVIGRKQNEIIQKMRQPAYNGPKSAAEYFGVWSLSGYRGQQKFRQYTNFDNTHYKKENNLENVFLYRFPQYYTEGVIGKSHQLIKMYSQNIKHLNALFLQNYQSNFHKDIHPESVLSRYLYNQSIGNIRKEGNKLTFYRLD